MSIVAQESSSSNIATTMRTTPASYALALTDGTGANQAQVAWSGTGTADADAGAELNPQALSDDRGTVNMSSVKAIYVRNRSQYDILSVSFSSWSSITPFAFTVRVFAGGCFSYVNPAATGWTTTSSSRVTLGISMGPENPQLGTGVQPSPVPYEIVLIGEGTVS
jgi:hypothetical protein